MESAVIRPSVLDTSIPITDPGETLRLLLVGKTGCGKSSAGNTILGDPVFHVHHGFLSHQSVAKQRRQVFGTAVEIVDTPGLFNTATDLAEDARQLVHAVQSLTPGPHAVLFVLHSAHRFSTEEYNAYKCLQKLFDPQISEHMIVIFTGGDLLEREGVSITELLAEAPKELSELLRECEQRYLVLDNTCPPQQRTQVGELLEMAKRLVNSSRRPRFQSPYNHLSPPSQDDAMMFRLKSFYLSELQAEEDFLREEKHSMGREAEKRKGISPVTPHVCFNCADFVQAFLERIVRHLFRFVFEKMSAAWTNENWL